MERQRRKNIRRVYKIDYMKDKKEYIKEQLGYLIIPCIAIAVGLVWPSFYWLSVGIITAAVIIISNIRQLIRGNKLDEEIFPDGIGGCIWGILLIIFSIAFLLFCDTRFLSPHGKKQHIYENCSSLKGKETKEVVKLQGFLYGCFSDCEICKQQKLNEEEQKKIERRKKREMKAEEERLEMIEMLKKELELLEKGEKADDAANHLERYLNKKGFIDSNYDDYDAYPEPNHR